MVRTSTTQRSARLPERPSSHPARDRLKGLVSLVAILAIVGGVPYLLYRLFGPPWPEKLPDRDVLFTELDAESVLKIIAFFIWLAWLHFVICLIAEIVGERRGRGISPRVPLGGGSQSLARRLVSGVVLLVGAASITVPVAQAVSAPSVGTQPAATSASPVGARIMPGSQVEQPSTVQPGVTGVRTNDDHSGQVVKYTEVRPPDGRNYDCLWDIAERYLGDGRRYKEIHDLNRNKLQPDGKRLTNPDLIFPGWQVRLPADAKGPGVREVKVAIGEKPVIKQTGDQTGKKTETKTETKTDKQTDQGKADKGKVDQPVVKKKTGDTSTDKSKTEPGPGQGRHTLGENTEKPSPVSLGDPVKDPSASKEQPTSSGRTEPHGTEHVAGERADDPRAGGSSVPEPAPAPVAEEGGIDPMKAGVYGFGATLLAAGLALALRRRRGWSIGPGPKSASHRQTEVDLRLAADVPTATFVDRSLRHLGAMLTDQGRPLPGVVAALVNDKAITLVLAPGEESPAPPAPPAPWQTVAEGRRWMLRRAYAPEMDVDAPAPYPSLVTVGRNADQSIVLIDLDLAQGIVSFGGLVNVARDVVGSIAVELATNLWSDGAHVTMVGFGDDLSALAPNRLRYRSSLAEAMTDVTRRTDAQVQACDQRKVESVTRARVAYPDPQLWGPELVVLSAPPSPEEAAALNRIAADPRRSVGVVVLGDVMSAPWRFVVDEKAQAVCRLLGLEVDAHMVSPAQFADLVTLFQAAEAESSDKTRPEDDPAAYELAHGDLSQRAAVEIDLLGPVEVDASGQVDPARQEMCTEIAAFLASQDYGVHPNVLAGSIWPRGISPELRDAALEHTRGWLGERAVYADENGRWVLNRDIVRIDWDVFRSLLKQASTMDDPRGPLSTALSLVHGPCWAELPAGRYSWLAATGIERKMAAAVIDTALKLAEASLRYDDGQLARTALQTGLRFAPASEDLWRATLRLASHFGTSDDVTVVATEMYAALTKHGGPRGAEAETDALVDELLPGFRRPRAAVA